MKIQCCGAAVWGIAEMNLYGWVAWTNLFVRGGIFQGKGGRE